MTDWPIWILVLVDVLAVHRLVRLVTTDTITRPIRERLVEQSYGDRLDGETPETPATPTMWSDFAEDDGDPPFVAGLVTCRWCASIWIAAGAVAAHGLVPALWLPLAGLLALSSASTLLAALED